MKPAALQNSFPVIIRPFVSVDIKGSRSILLTLSVRIHPVFFGVRLRPAERQKIVSYLNATIYEGSNSLSAIWGLGYLGKENV